VYLHERRMSSYSAALCVCLCLVSSNKCTVFSRIPSAYTRVRHLFDLATSSCTFVYIYLHVCVCVVSDVVCVSRASRSKFI